MKLVRNWKRIALRSYSMWAVYAGIAMLAGPEIWFLVAGYDLVSPYLTGWAGLALLIGGAVGRIVDQGIGDA